MLEDLALGSSPEKQESHYLRIDVSAYVHAVVETLTHIKAPSRLDPRVPGISAIHRNILAEPSLCISGFALNK